MLKTIKDVGETASPCSDSAQMSPSVSVVTANGSWRFGAAELSDGVSKLSTGGRSNLVDFKLKRVVVFPPGFCLGHLFNSSTLLLHLLPSL